MTATPLTLDEMRRVIDRRGGPIPRVPVFWNTFYNQGTIEKYGEPLKEMTAASVVDCQSLLYVAPGDFEAPEGADPDYKWAVEPDPGDLADQGITSRRIVSSVEKIDEFIAAIPDPSRASYYEYAAGVAQQNPDSYCVGWDFFCLFERAWFLFGMEEILCEMLANPDRMRRLLRAFTDYHKAVMTGYAEAGAHGYFTSDDLGTQNTCIFRPETFRELYMPFYEEMIAHCHSLGMHFWLHSCGAVADLLDDFVSMGLDVLHPVQPVAMDQAEVARKYGDKLTFLAGMDVQYILPNGTPEEVAEGTKRLVDTFDREEGGCILAASNAIMPETPLENIRTWLETCESYGTEKRKAYSS